MDRRTFLKMAGMGSVAFAAGCNAHPERHLYTLVRAPEDMVTGEATWYATTCRECPAGCGVLAKNREGRVVKLEGNPLHPVNQGKLCARGHAALQGLYHPDLVRTPLLKKDGHWEPIGNEKAMALIRQHAEAAAKQGTDRVALVSEVAGDDMLALFDTFLSAYNATGPQVFEPFAFESLKKAHTELFGRPILPGYHIDEADLIVGFGAEFLETWLSPVEYARKFKAMHALKNGHKGAFVHVGPFQSLTAANADQWLGCRPGSEAAVALALIRQLLQMRHGMALPWQFRDALARMVKPYTPAEAARRADLDAVEIVRLARRLELAKRPLVLPTGTAPNGDASAAADLATVMLNAVLDPAFSRYDFERRHRVEIADDRQTVMQVWQRMADKNVDLLLLNNVNPLYALPEGTGVRQALAGGNAFVVAFSSMMDETAAAADLIVPVLHPLASWGAYESKRTLVAMRQPTVGKMGTAMSLGDIFLNLLPPDQQPAETYRQYLVDRLSRRAIVQSETDWLHLIQSGGRFPDDQSVSEPPVQYTQASVDRLAALMEKQGAGDNAQLALQATSSLRFFDGRHADRPWMPEIPDPVSQVAWQTLVMVHPQTLADKGCKEGQPLRITTKSGAVTLPAYSHPGLHPMLMVIPAGQGHTQMGRYARNQGVNPVALLNARNGVPDYSVFVSGLAVAGPKVPLASVSGSRTQYHRKIALSVDLAAATETESIGKGLAMDDFPFTLPLPEGYDHSRDIYPAHDHEGYRWGMAVDLDRCIGCSACVAGCYSENNVGVVGEQHIIEGREMAWIRIERYQDADDPTRLIFLPMLCQHCDNAPCESVCPVYAPHHSKEGLNNQIYNRCIGTRFCAQNCPYKVRRFNWFDWQWPEPLNLQLNPDVTVRSKGVMEKCSFCIQRIKKAHNQAKNEKRDIRDGEVIPACVQTCPTSALVFGNLMDPDSTVRKMISDPRAYQVIGYLNTKPAVVYLKKVVQTI